MSIDVTYVLSHSILLVIEFTIFLLSFTIYKKTKGASLAYKMWAIATFLMLISTTIRLTNGILFEGTVEISNNRNEFFEIFGAFLMALGYFYIPVGVMYLSKDFNVGIINKDLIKKSQVIFFSLICSLTVIYLILLPFYEIIKTVAILALTIYFSVWIFTLFIYKGIYEQVLKYTNKCWLYLYLGVLFLAISEIFQISAFFVSWAEYLKLIFQLLSAVGFIDGFYKMAKMVEAF